MEDRKENGMIEDDKEDGERSRKIKQESDVNGKL